MKIILKYILVLFSIITCFDKDVKAQKMIKDGLFVRDTIYENMLSYPCWRVVAATYDNTPARYIGGKIVHQYKEVLFRFRGGFKIMYEYYDTWQSGEKKYELKTIHYLPRERIYYCSKDKLVIYNFEEWWHKRGNYFVLEPATLEDVEEWERGYEAYEQQQRKIQEQTNKSPQKDVIIGDSIIIDLPIFEDDYANRQLEAIIRENGLDRELALKCYNMNIQRDMSSRPKISNAVAIPPSQPIATMRAEQVEVKTAQKERR